MFVIRQAGAGDHVAVQQLLECLPDGVALHDGDAGARLTAASREAFAGRGESSTRRYGFLLEDAETASVVGLAVLRERVGGPDDPLTYLRIDRRQHYSDDLQAGQVHVTLTLAVDPAPCCAFAGLALLPSYRRHRDVLAGFLALARAHYVAIHPERFSDRVVAELPAPRGPGGRRELWEALGRRFVNLSFEEALRFRVRSREFIASLFPGDPIYASLLPAEARHALGRVDEEAHGARRALERLGLGYRGRVDPLGGGPIMEAELAGLPWMIRTRSTRLGDPAPNYPSVGLVSVLRDGQFRAARTRYMDGPSAIAIPGEAAGLLGVHVEDGVGLTPLG
jgi:arginine N-succinyltransferase